MDFLKSGAPQGFLDLTGLLEIISWCRRGEVVLRTRSLANHIKTLNNFFNCGAALDPCLDPFDPAAQCQFMNKKSIGQSQSGAVEFESQKETRTRALKSDAPCL